MSGMFGDAFGEVRGLLGGGGHEAAGGLLGTALNSVGGVQGLMQRADQAGLGDKVQSWVGTGQNWPISPAEIQKIFPEQEVEQFAQAHGIPAGVVPQVLAHLLPHAVDQATPDGDAAAADQNAGVAGAGGAPGDPAQGPAQPGTASQGAGGFDFMSLASRFLGRG